MSYELWVMSVVGFGVYIGYDGTLVLVISYELWVMSVAGLFEYMFMGYSLFLFFCLHGDDGAADHAEEFGGFVVDAGEFLFGEVGGFV